MPELETQARLPDVSVLTSGDLSSVPELLCLPLGSDKGPWGWVDAGGGAEAVNRLHWPEEPIRSRIHS